MLFTPLTEVPPVRGVLPADCDFYHRFEVPELGEQPVMRFEPEPGRDAVDTWWRFTPAIIRQMLGVWGFAHARTSLHRQPYYKDGKPYEIDLFTVIAARSPDLLP